MEKLLKLKKYIESQGYTLYSLASELECTPELLYSHFASRSDMRPNMARKLIKVFHNRISFNDIYRD